jgi:hypothetical protein
MAVLVVKPALQGSRKRRVDRTHQPEGALYTLWYWSPSRSLGGSESTSQSQWLRKAILNAFPARDEGSTSRKWVGPKGAPFGANSGTISSSEGYASLALPSLGRVWVETLPSPDLESAYVFISPLPPSLCTLAE